AVEHLELAGEQVERLVLVDVSVPCRSGARRDRRLHEPEGPVGARRLELDRAHHAIEPRGDAVSGGHVDSAACRISWVGGSLRNPKAHDRPPCRGSVSTECVQAERLPRYASEGGFLCWAPVTAWEPRAYLERRPHSGARSGTLTQLARTLGSVLGGQAGLTPV